MNSCLDSVFPRMPTFVTAVPDERDLFLAAKNASDSAPGPDGLPYRVWLATPNSFSILAELATHLFNGFAIPHALNRAMMAMFPKGRTCWAIRVHLRAWTVAPPRHE
eukprot:2023199-Pyramimonas_sp.AAC.1